jgi:hypothetical protein
MICNIGKAGFAGRGYPNETAFMSDYEQPVATLDTQLRSRTLPAKKNNHKIRSWWLKQFRTWHWISAAVSLVGMFLFAITGLTLNHAATISAKPQVTEHSAVLSRDLLTLLAKRPADMVLPDAVSASLLPTTGLDTRGRTAEWSDEEVYVALPGPGRDAWVSIDRATGEVKSENTDRGWVSYFNDLHKGRNSGTAWFWFIDIFAVACMVFTLTGLLLLNLHAKHRPTTWPLVGLGVAIPLIIAILFLH